MRQIICKETIEINNELLQINAGIGRGSCYVEILESLYREMQGLLSIHNKVLVFRIDLRLYEYTGDNKIVSKILRKVKRWLNQHYQINRVGHLWVREQEQATQQHYHLMIMVDGNKVRTPHKIIEQIEHQAEYRGLAKPFTPKNCYTMIKRNDKDSFAKAFKRGSYLAKTRSKGHKGDDPKQANKVNNYSASRIKLKAVI